MDQLPQMLSACLLDSPLSDEVNKLVTELADWEHWRILGRTQDQLD